MVLTYFVLVIFLAAALFFVRRRQVVHVAVWAFVALQWALTIYAFQHKGQVALEYFTFDSLGLILLGVLSIIAVPAFYHSYIFFKTRKDVPRERGIYFCAMVGLVASLSAAYLANHIAVTWIFVELTTLSASALIYHNRNERTLEATWKYIFVCSISITLVFIGILFLTITIQEEGFTSLTYAALVEHAPQLNEFWLKLAFIFIFTGFTVKAGLVPMYTVGIDAKDKAPGPAGALLAGALVNVGFAGIFRFYEVVSNTTLTSWANSILFVSGILSIFVSAVYILRVKNLKRMLAYSGVEHMGIVMLGIAAGGAGYFAAILHLILHTFAKSSLFFQVDQIYRIYRSKSIYDIGNYFHYSTPGAIALLLGFFVITAMPPSGMFVTEFMIFHSIFNAGKIVWLVVIFILLSLIIWSLARNVFKMLFIKTVGFREDRVPKISPTESISQFILLGLVVYLGFNPPAELIVLIREATQNLHSPL